MLIKKATTNGRPIELSNGNIVTSNFYQLVLIEKLNKNNNPKLYQISSYSKLGLNEIECIIECSKTEICASSTYDELLGFFNKKTLKCKTYTHSVNVGPGSLCMLNKKLLFVINIHGEQYSLIDIEKHEVVSTITNKKERIFLYAIKLSKNEILLAFQNKWKNWVESVRYQLGIYRYVPFREPTPIYLRHLIYNEKEKKFHNFGQLEIKHTEALNDLLYLKNNHLVTCSSFKEIEEEEEEEDEEVLRGWVIFYKLDEESRKKKEKEHIIQILLQKLLKFYHKNKNILDA